jgi:hypothetical protein
VRSEGVRVNRDERGDENTLDWDDKMIELRSDRGGRDRLKGHLAGVVVETNFEPVEHSRAAEKIKPDTETLEKPIGAVICMPPIWTGRS